MAIKEMFTRAQYGPFLFENTETDTQWGYEKKQHVLYLTLQFTASKQDWKDNLDAFQVPYKDMPRKFYAHQGFLKKWKSIRSQIHEIITSEITEVYITGFSQGAALATLAHEDIWFNFPHLQSSIFTWTFGSPRVFSWGAPKERFQNLTRIENGNDIVTKVPFFWMGYTHVGNVVHIGKMRLPFLFSIKQHYFEEYKEKI